MPIRGEAMRAERVTAVRRPFAPVPDSARQHAVRMSDGVLLATDVYLPARGARWPVLVVRLPYDKAGDECFVPDIGAWFAERGYAVVAQDVRGKVRSDGPVDPFVAEVTDGYDTIDWVASQPWCDGSVGMFGDSYYGFTQWAAAASAHPALRAITPRAAAADLTHALYRQGVFMLEMGAYWAVETWVDEALYDYDGALDWSVRPLSDIAPRALDGRRPTGLDAWAHRRFSDTVRLPVRGDIPALHIGGYYDFLLRGQLSTWRQARTAGRATQHLMLGAVDHVATPLREPGEPAVDPTTSPALLRRMLDVYLGPLLPFFEHHLRGRGDYDVAPVRWQLARADDRWREDHQWPPTGSRPATWYLGGDPSHDDGALRLRSDTTARTATWTHDPHHPVPSRVHPYYTLLEPPDEHDLHIRPDVLTFTTEPLPRPLDLAGPVELRMKVSGSAASAHVIATVCDVLPDGRTQPVLDGAALAAAPWPARLRIDLGDTGYRLRQGHRLRLTLAASAFPRYALHPGTDGHFWTTTRTALAEQSVILGGPEGAQVTCHVLAEREQHP